MTSYDVVIVGGGATGSSVAFHLLSDPDFSGRVLVVEKDATYRLAASALSAASIRQQYSQPVNIRMSLYGIGFLRDIGRHLAVDGEAPAIGLSEAGYLYLAGEAHAEALRENHVAQRREGADIRLLDRSALGERFPWLALDGVTLGSWGASGEGWFDGWALLQAFRRKARHLGAEYRQDEVVGLEVTGGCVVGVHLREGGFVACGGGALVNCAGTNGPRIAAMAGIPLPVQAKRRSVFAFTCRTPLQAAPLLIDMSGVWMRPEGRPGPDGQTYIAGWSPPPESDPDWRDEDPDTQAVDWSLFEEVVWPALAARVPAFQTIRPGRAWAGPYDMNLFDHNAVLGPAADVENLYLCNGFSGHGLQQSPAVGRGLAERIIHGRYTTLDLFSLGYERLAAGKPLLEQNVI
ncbi:NAD(P)/FAD-dependent oxidoreductase [uncultured Enterovirga sp.]|uniref:NAD(P)/FAD-dependent oxidoreductase n=1 Tax=uncultured Enterovirga sp. TaxID=2026352 RepID=UPI0035CABA20